MFFLDYLLAFAELNRRNLFWDLWYRRAKQLELGGAFLFQNFDDISQDIPLHFHNISMIFDESHLDIQAGIFVDMTRCTVLFSPINVTSGKYTLENAHHDLLIKLRALTEVRDVFEVFNIE